MTELRRRVNASDTSTTEPEPQGTGSTTRGINPTEPEDTTDTTDTSEYESRLTVEKA